MCHRVKINIYSRTCSLQLYSVITLFKAAVTLAFQLMLPCGVIIIPMFTDAIGCLTIPLDACWCVQCKPTFQVETEHVTAPCKRVCDKDLYRIYCPLTLNSRACVSFCRDRSTSKQINYIGYCLESVQCQPQSRYRQNAQDLKTHEIFLGSRLHGGREFISHAPSAALALSWTASLTAVSLDSQSWCPFFFKAGLTAASANHAT